MVMGMNVPTGYLHLTKGSKVEVTSDEEGYKDAWFSAIILNPEPSNPTPKRKRKSFSSSSKVLLQYETLVVDDDSGKPLIELVDVDFIRPPPPSDNGFITFGPGDVVDAFWLDGWWPGVVMKFEGNKYTVGFEAPPDLLELGRSGLRPHWEFSQGVWVRPEKKMITGSIFSPGTAVEVNLNEKHLFYAWFSASYLGQIGPDSFLVQYKSSSNSSVKAVLKLHQIRPLPPKLGKINFSSRELVDVLLDDMGWWVGEITNAHPGKKYMVHFKFTKQEKDCSHSELRPHVDWMDGKWVTRINGMKWVTCFEDGHFSMDYELQSKHACERFRNSKVATPLPSSGATKDNTKETTPLSRISWKTHTKHLTPSINKSPYGRAKKKLKMSLQPNDEATILSVSKNLNWEHSGDSFSLAQLYTGRTAVKPSNKEAPVRHSWKTEQQKFREMDNHAKVSFQTKGKRRSLIEKADEVDVADEHVMDDSESSGIGSESEVIGGSHVGRSCLLPMEEVEQQNEDLTSSEVIGKEILPALLVECSKDPEKDCINDISQIPVIARSDLAGEKHNGFGVTAQVELTETQAAKDKGSEETTDQVEIVDSAIDIEKVIEKIVKGSSNPASICNLQNEVYGIQVETDVTGFLSFEEATRERETLDSALDFMTNEVQVTGIPAKKSAHEQPSSLCIDEIMHAVKTIEGSNNTAGSANQQNEVNRRPVETGVTDAVRETETLDFAMDYLTEEVQVAVAEISVKKSTHDQPLSFCKDEGNSVKTIEGSINTAGTTNQQNVVRDTEVEPGVTVTIEHQGNPCLPFKKSYRVWEEIESMGAFKRYPQNPHFRPLVKSREVAREGLAFGNMLTFASLVDRTSKLQVDDPIDLIDSSLEVLVELEMLGFDVKAVRQTLHSLLEMKAKLGQLQDQSKELKTELMECTRERTKHDESVIQVVKEIKALQEKRMMLLSIYEAKGSEISRLQSKASDITKDIQSILCDFEKQAAATL